MPPSRFSQVSRYRNATLTQSKPDERYAELGLASLPDNGNGKLVRVTLSSHIIARASTSSNALIVLPHTASRKYNKQPPIISNVCSGQLGDFDVCAFQENDEVVLLASGSLQGNISLQKVKLPLHIDKTNQASPMPVPSQPELIQTLSLPSLEAVSNLSFHPTSPSIFFTASHKESNIYIWDAISPNSPRLQYDGGGSSHWDAQWSPDGQLIAACGRDSITRIWDPRHSNTSIKISAHASKVKPSKATFITARQTHLLLTTGFSQMRQREIAIWDQRNPSSALKRITMDVASSPLDPVTDHDRGIVYLTAKGESSIRWLDVGSEDQGGTFAEGAHALSFPATSAALGPPRHLEVEVGEIGRLYVAATASSAGGASASDCIVPVSIRVPRRTYIDFHSDLYPLVPDKRGVGVVSDKWFAGENPSLPLMSLDPSMRGNRSEEIEHRSITAQPVEEDAVLMEPIKEALNTNPSLTSSESTAPPADLSSIQAEPSIRTITNGTKASIPSTAKSISSPSKSSSFPHWSRRFLAGTTPLIPSFHSLASLDISRAPAAKMLAVSTEYIYFPLSGPGGRLGVHPIKQEGRLPLHIPSLQHGAILGDFVVDPFHQDQIITSAADGIIRLWKMPAISDKGEEWSSDLVDGPIRSVELSGNLGSNKVTELCPHPFIEGLVAVIPADADAKLHLIDMSTTMILKSISMPSQGIYSATWSHDGSVLAAAGKDKVVYILDVRSKGSEAKVLGKAEAHDSPRPFNVVWINQYSLLTVGHTTGSLRQIKLYDLDYTSSNILSERVKQSLDVSPSILFPYWDADVNILRLWSKGERLISSFEIQSGNEKDPILTLPVFQHNHPQLGLAFLRKDCVNVREVEIDCSIRLCKEEMQRVAWKITRSRPEYFQDDIYQPSIIVDQSLMEVSDWMSGKDIDALPLKSLQPDGMIPLSLAPPVARSSNLPKGPIHREKTDKEREEEMLSNIFEKAKGNDNGKDPNHNEEQAARAPNEDDWDSD